MPRSGLAALVAKRVVSRAAKLMRAIFYSVSAVIPGFASLNIFTADVANLRRESGR